MKQLKGLILLLLLSVTSLAWGQEYKEFEWLVTDSLKMRQEMLDSEKYISELTVKGNVLTGTEVAMINDEAMRRFKHGEAAIDFLGYIKYTVKKRVKKKFKPSIDQLKDTMMFLGLSVTIADSYLFSYSKIRKNKKLRRLLNSPDSAIGKGKNLFKKSTKLFFSFKNRKYIRRAIKVYKKFYLNKKADFAHDEEFARIDDVIQMSYMYEKLEQMRFIDKVGQFFGVLGQKIGNVFKLQADFYAKLGNGIVFKLSKYFGNSVGMLQSRKGKLFMNHEFMKTVKSELEPLDILFEKTPFRATDSFIPGYWGHAAIYIGNEQQIRKLGIWDHPVIQEFHYDIRLGKTIVEALRPGVEFNTFRHFTDIDDFAVVRKRDEMSREDKIDHIIRALKQVGKKYDFGFNAEMPDTIVCSELHYTVWRGLDFETTKYIGRSTLNVDQVVKQGLAGMSFEPIILYIDGKKIDQNIQATYDSIYRESEFNTTIIRALSNDIPEVEVDIEGTIQNHKDLIGGVEASF